MRGTNGISITNNIIYNTYRSGIIVTGRNNDVSNNLVTTIYWLGSGQQPSTAQFNMNNDGAIMSRDAVSVTMRVGVRRSNVYVDQRNKCCFHFRIILLLVLND